MMMGRPTVLLVEDRVKIRDHLSREFHKAGARVLSAANANDAYKLFRHRASEISALVTDIRLEDESDHDISGIELARNISEVDPDLPMFGVTAFDASVGDGVLDLVLRKAADSDPMSIYQHISHIVAKAAHYDESRFVDVPESLVRLKAKYGISAEDFERLISSWRVADLGRVAFLAWHDVQEPDQESSDDILGRGRSIKFVRRGTTVGQDGVLHSDVAVVIREVAGGAIAELFGMPLIYAYSDSSTEAIEALLEHLFECYRMMGSPDEFLQADFLDVVRFRAFLNRLFESAEIIV